MKKVLPLVIILFCSIVVFGQISRKIPNAQGNNKSKQIKPWTILVFMNGDNNLEPDAIEDINEMESAIDTSVCNVIVEIDRIPGFDASNGNWTTTRDYFILHDNNTSTINSFLSWDPGELNMGNPQTLIDFANYYIDACPAYNYCLILWDHGSGWYKKDSSTNTVFKGISYDDTDNDNLGVANGEFYSALNSISSHYGYKIDLLGMDACLMAMQEVAYEAKNFVYTIAFSEHTEPGDGYPYNDILNALNSNPSATPPTLAYNIVNLYTLSYATGGSQFCSASATQSAIYLDSYYDVLSSSINSFAQQLINAGGVSNSDIYAARYITQQFATPEHIDLYDFANEIQNTLTLPLSLRNSAATVKTNITNVLIGNGYFSYSSGFNVSYSNGLAMYYPLNAPSGLNSSYPSLYVTSVYPNWWTFLQGIGTVIQENNFESNNKIIVYPSPTKGNITIEYPSIKNEAIITLYNIQGQLLQSQPLQQDKFELDISNFDKGVYVLTVVGNDINISKKIIKE